MVIEDVGLHREYFQGGVFSPSDFTSGPVLGLTPNNLQFNLISSGTLFSSTAFPDPFPAISGFYFHEVSLSFGPNSANLYAILNNVTTTSVIPVPASVWLFGGALGVMGAIRRKAVV